MGTLYFYISYWRWDRHFTLSSEPCKGPAICKAKAVPPFLSHFKTLSVGPIPGIEPTTSRAAVKHSTDWANPAAVKTTIPSYHYYWYLCSVPVHLNSWTPTRKWEEVWRVIDVCLQTQNASSVTTSSWSLNCGEIARYLTSSLNLFICATIRREKSLCHIAMVAKFAWQQTENSHKKWSRTVSNFIDLIQLHLICQMLAKFSVMCSREIRKFHDVQRWLKNVQKSVMCVQSCCFTVQTYCFFCHSCCRRRCCCLSSLLLWSKNFATMVMWHHTSPL